MGMKQTCHKCNSTIQTGGVSVLCSSCREKELGGKMNKITEHDLLKRLNDVLYEKGLSSKLEFSMSICSGSFGLFLHEIEEFGWKVLVYDSNDPFSEKIEMEYEEDKINWDQAVILEIKRNLNQLRILHFLLVGFYQRNKNDKKSNKLCNTNQKCRGNT